MVLSLVRPQRGKMALMAIFLSSSTSVYADDQVKVAPSRAKVKAEKIQVTGSRIKRLDQEGVTPVTTIDRDEIERSGVTSVAELLRSTTMSPTGNFSGSSGYIRSGSATADLLGIGSGRTLVLLDGKRLPVDQSIGAVNIDNIPLSIVERVELLRGGASAVYGSDAVGGVVNIITKADYVGNEASTSASIPMHGGGEVLKATALSAFRVGSSTKVMITAGVSKQNETLLKNRDISTGRAPRDYTASISPDGTYSYRVLKPKEGGGFQLGSWTPSANCPEGNQKATVPSRPDNVYCAGRRSDTKSRLAPSSQNLFATVRVDSQVNDRIDVSVTTMMDQKTSVANMGNYLNYTGHPINGTGVLLSSGRAADFGITAQDDDMVELLVRTDDMDDRRNSNTDQTYGGTINMEADLPAFTLNSSYTYFKSTNRRNFDNVLNKQKQIGLLHQNVDPAYIPIDPARNRAFIDNIHDDLNSSENSTGSLFDTYLTKELYELPGGPLTVLFGVAYSREDYTQIPDDRDLEIDPTYLVPVYTGSAATKGSGDRSVASAYTELNIPFLPGADVTLALRTDQYSDFGQTTNYSFGSKVKLTDSLLARFNVASSFRSPTLADIHQKGGGGYRYVEDEKWCTRERELGNTCEPGGGHQIFVDSPGNKDLKEETGKTYTVGTIFQPSRNFALLVDYIAVHLENTFGSDNTQDLVDDWYAGKSTGQNVIRHEGEGADRGIITSLGMPIQNQGTLDVYAISTELDVNGRVDDVRLSYGANYFNYISYKVQENTDTPSKQQRGYGGVPVWRMDQNIGATYDQHHLGLSSHTIARQITDPEDRVQGRDYFSVDEYTRYDTAYTLAGDRFNFIIGVRNIFDKIGGKDKSASVIGSEGVNSSIYSIAGRTYFTGLTARF